jgi:hypothetical protein
MRQQQDCSCGGSNENCAHCNGSGFVWAGRDSKEPRPNSVNPPLHRRASLPLALPLSPRKEQRAMTGNPSFYANGPGVQSKTGSARPSKSANVPQSPRRKVRVSTPSRPARVPTDEPMACPLCHLKFAERLFDEHVFDCWVRSAGHKPVPGHAAPPKRPTVASGKLLVCPLCKAQVKAGRFDRHISLKCPMRAAREGRTVGIGARSHKEVSVQTKTAGSMRSSGTAPGVATKDQRGIHGEASLEALTVAQTIDRMDATRGMGHVARENGRFGSHPIYDSCDDESGPDG